MTAQHPPQHHFSGTLPEQVFLSRRTPVWGREHMAATTQGPAVEAALSMLRAGGTAADAAVAAVAVLGVMEPMSTGLGGDGFLLHYEAATRTVHALNGSGKSARAFTPELLASRGFGLMPPPRHALTVSVPGAFGLWCECLRRHGRLDLAQVLAPAIECATEGFVLAPVAAWLWGCGAREVLRHAPGGDHFLPGGEPPEAGDVVRNPELAHTLGQLAAAGSLDAAFELFYRGDIAERITRAVQDAGGALKADDLAGYAVRQQTPISTVYRGKRVHQCPPNGQGLVGLIALNILSELHRPDTANPYDPARLHAQIEALRLAFGDARQVIADPGSANPNQASLQERVAGLLSQEHARERAALIRPDRAGAGPHFSTPLTASDTVYLCVVDREGNACSMINSVFKNFGTGIVPQGLGFSLQNRGACFTPVPGHPNAPGPGKRPYHTIIPGMLTHADSGPHQGELYGPFGVMGGYMQPQGHVQVLAALLDDAANGGGLDPQSALNRLRFCIEDGTPEGAVALEEGMPDAAIKTLFDMGHPVKVVGGFARALFGRGQIILRDPATGRLCAGSDPRGDGMAFGR